MKERFVIISGGRCGSTMLGTALSCHPDVMCFGEILESPWPSDYQSKGVRLPVRGRRKCTHYIAQVSAMVDRFDRSVWGFRMKDYQLRAPGFWTLFAVDRYALIHVRRQNVVAQSLSMHLAEMSDFTWWDNETASGEYRRLGPLSPAAVLARASYYQDMASYAARRAMASKCRYLAIEYSAIAKDFAAPVGASQPALESVFTQLNLPSYYLTPETRRQKTCPYQKLIPNFDEIMRYISARGTGWERMCRSLLESSQYEPAPCCSASR